MGINLDLKNQKFGRLLALRPTNKRVGRKIVWECLCDCGNIAYVTSNNLRRGTKSCGCLTKERLSNRKTHGMRTTKEYHVWVSMKQRCFNPNSHAYNLYGARGITVCERWKNSFEHFFEDMGECPAGFWLDRLNNEGDYEPKNCKWSSPKQQAKNRRPYLLIEYNGIRMPQKDWAKKLKIGVKTLRKYLAKGESIGEIINRKEAMNNGLHIQTTS